MSFFSRKKSYRARGRKNISDFRQFTESVSRAAKCMLGRQASELNGKISQAIVGGGDVEKVRHVWRGEAVNGPECIQQDF